MSFSNLQFLQNTLLTTQNIYSWTLTADFRLLYTNCPEQDFFFNLFAVSKCKSVLDQHFCKADAPLIAADRTGFVWIGVLQAATDEKQENLIHLLGPVFTSAMTEKYLQQRLKAHNVSPMIANRMWRYVKDIPAISTDMATTFASMLHAAVNDTTVRPAEIEIWNDAIETDHEIEWGADDWHGDWAAEQEFIRSIAEGRIVDLTRITTGKLGNIGGGDPLRQAKNMMIVFSVMCSRAAIMGGVSVEGSMALSDYFLQEMEAADTITAVNAIGNKMYLTYIERVQKARKNLNYATLVQVCMEYVQTHILEQIKLEDLAEYAGYTRHYISHKFKEETGISLFEYINRQKINLAKDMLKNSTISVAELSARLGYTSPSYFCAVFKKITGVTPLEYDLQ